MKKLIFFPLFLLVFFACKKDEVVVSNENDIHDISKNFITNMTIDKNGIATLEISPIHPDGAAQDRTTCTVYHCTRYRDGDDFLTASAVNADVEFRILLQNLSTLAVTAVTSYQTATNVQGLNISWLNAFSPTASGYRYVVGYKKCVRNSGSGALHAFDFFSDDYNSLQADPYWNAQQSGQMEGPVPANTVPNEWAGGFQLTSGCSVF